MGTSKFKTIEDLEQAPFFRRLVQKRRVCLALTLAVSAMASLLIMALHVEPYQRHGRGTVFGYEVYFDFDRWQTYFWMAVLAFWSGVTTNQAVKKILEGPNIIPLFPQDASGGRVFGKSTGPAIVEMTQRLAQKMGVSGITRILIADQPDPNAFTVRLIGVGDLVLLNRNLLEIMPPECVEAVIAHELGHVRGGDSLIKQLVNVPKSFVIALGCVLAWKLAGGLFLVESWTDMLSKLFLVLLAAGLLTLVWSLVENLHNNVSRQDEYIADSYAAWACGMGDMLNALLLLGERGEAILALRIRLEGHPVIGGKTLDEGTLGSMLNRVSTMSLDEGRAYNIAQFLFIETHLREVRDRLLLPLNDDEVFTMAQKAEEAWVKRGEEMATQAAELRAKESPEERQVREKKEADDLEKWKAAEELLVKWRAHDTDSSGYLDDSEIEAFMADLTRNEKRMLFRQFTGPGAKMTTHPTIRQRLIHLHKTRAGE
jgi:Zn-dependent protease with chaperone function